MGTAMAWVRKGYSLEFVDATLRPKVQARFDSEKDPPKTLSFWTGALDDAHAALQASGNGEDREMAQWRTRLSSWRSTGQWAENIWGPAPGESGCMVPAELYTLRGAAGTDPG